MNKLFEASLGGIGVPQQIGYGKDYHTANPEPITWENITDLDYFVTSLPSGKFLAGISLPDSEMSTHTYEFNGEEDAMTWIRNAAAKYKVEKFNQG